MTTTVTCEQCGKQFTGWHTRRFCYECQKLRNAESSKRSQARCKDKVNSEEYRERKKKYYAAHREHYSEYNRRWREDHPDYHRQWLANRESAKE